MSLEKHLDSIGQCKDVFSNQNISKIAIMVYFASGLKNKVA
jgi:hypothetical protein